MQTDAALQLTDATFDAEVRNFKGLVLVDFWATWCGPCQIMTPRIEELALKYKDKGEVVKIAQLNIDENQVISNEFRILSIPSFLFFQNGEQVEMMVGVKPTADLDKKITELLPKTTPAAA